MDESKQKELNDMLFKESVKYRFGVVMFDLCLDKNNKLVPHLGRGWASIGGKKSFRINSTGELANDVRWWTNLQQETFWKIAVQQRKLRASNYLRTDMGQIIKEIGLDPKKLTIPVVCEVLSELFSKVMKLSIEFYNITSLDEQDLVSELKKTLIDTDKNIAIFVDEALMRSFQDFVFCEKVMDMDYKHITLRRPRLNHAKRIVETPIPEIDNGWDFLTASELPLDNNERNNFFLNSKKPFIAKVTINSYMADENEKIDLSKLLNLGNAIGEKGIKKERNWVSQPEFMYLSKFCDLYVEGAFFTNGYKNIEVREKILELGPLSDHSFSLGLIAECYWVALSSRSVNLQTKSKTLVSPRACWLRATDRFLTFSSAMMLSASGFTVVSYGLGGVNVAVKNEQIKNLIEIAPHAGLVVPVSVIDSYSIFADSHVIID